MSPRIRVLAAVAVCVAGMSPAIADDAAGQSPSRGVQQVATAQAAVSTVVWAVGDLCDNDHAELDCDDVGRLISRDGATDAVLALGDLQYENGALASFSRYYDAKMGRGKGLWNKTFPVPGNHEYLSAGAAGYFGYWQGRAGDRSRGYYGVTLGGWQLVAANSNCARVGGCAATSPQGRYIAGYLDRAGSCELVFDHHPAFSDGSHGDYAGGRALLGVAYANRAELFLSGHDHSYQRFAPRRPDGTVSAAAGVAQFVVGTGGRNLTGFRGDRHRTQYRQNSRFGALRLALTPTGYTARFVSVSGATMDTASGTCHR